jgi:hypothetical protein
MQSTRGQPQNDVIHSKYVGSDGDIFEVSDFDIYIGTQRYSYRGGAHCYYSGIARYAACVAKSAGMYRSELWYSRSGRWYVDGYKYTHSMIQITIEAYTPRNESLTQNYVSRVTFNYRFSDALFKVGSVTGAGTDLYSVGDMIPMGALPDGALTEKEIVAVYSLMTDIAMTRARLLFEAMLGRRDLPYQSTSGTYEVSVEPLKDEPDGFLFQEPLRIGSRIDPLLLGNGIENNSYWFNWLVQHSYVDALHNMPRLNDNSVSNVLGLVSFIKALVIDHRVEIPHRLQDAWLQYRYVAKTTELDVKEAIRFMNRYYPNTGMCIKTYGTATTNVQDTDVLCRCRIGLRSRELGTLDRIWRALYTYGLQPNFYMIWDMIPYSFIVDWFLPIGDVASNVDLLNNYSKQNYDFDSVVYSLEYIREYDNGPDVHCYSRWSGEPLESTNDLYWFDRPSTSNRVKLYRILDTASLTVS